MTQESSLRNRKFVSIKRKLAEKNEVIRNVLNRIDRTKRKEVEWNSQSLPPCLPTKSKVSLILLIPNRHSSDKTRTRFRDAHSRDILGINSPVIGSIRLIGIVYTSFNAEIGRPCRSDTTANRKERRLWQTILITNLSFSLGDGDGDGDCEQRFSRVSYLALFTSLYTVARLKRQIHLEEPFFLDQQKNK